MTGADWLALGDSFTAGTADDPAHGGWVARTVAHLVADGLVHGYGNVAVPGVRIASVLDQLTAVTGAHAVVSVVAGANDVLAYDWDPAAVEAGTAALVTGAGRHGRLVLTSTCPDFFARRWGRPSRLSARVDHLNESVRAAAAAVGPDRVLVLDTHAVLTDGSLWDDDGIHPNPRGHETLARDALALLRPALARFEAQAAPCTSRITATRSSTA